MKTKIAILASGRGSNACNIVDTINKENLPLEITCLLTDNEDAEVIPKMLSRNVRVEVQTVEKSRLVH